MSNVILIGMPGSGKSTVGVMLAKQLGCGFVDVDLVIQDREQALLQDLLDEHGVEAFLDMERDAVCSLHPRRCVIATGGSAVCRPDAAAHLKTLGTLVYLRTPVEELRRRIANLSTRGIAALPGQTLEDILAAREPLYTQYADLVLDCPAEQSMARTVELLCSRLAHLGLGR